VVTNPPGPAGEEKNEEIKKENTENAPKGISRVKLERYLKAARWDEMRGEKVRTILKKWDWWVALWVGS